MAIEIKDVRASFIWAEASYELLSDDSAAPFAFLARWSTYRRKFNQIATAVSSSDPIKLERPWPGPAGQLFWTYYLGGQHPGYVKADLAWKHMVPFRAKVPVLLGVPGVPDPGRVEAFFYPHCVMLVVTIGCRVDRTLENEVTALFDLRRSGAVQATWPTAGSRQLSLEQFADRTLATLRVAARGSHASPGQRTPAPFSVVTVIRGDGVDPSAMTADGGPIHRALEAVTRWSPTHAHDTLEPLETASLLIRRSPPSHLLYASHRGRAVWFPALFTGTGARLSSLSCYHRNLVLASLQTEALCLLTSETAAQLAAGASLSIQHRECAQLAAEILGRLHAGERSTYRSSSVRAQISQAPRIADLNSVRQFFGMPAL